MQKNVYTSRVEENINGLLRSSSSQKYITQLSCRVNEKRKKIFWHNLMFLFGDI